MQHFQVDKSGQLRPIPKGNEVVDRRRVVRWPFVALMALVMVVVLAVAYMG